MCVCACHQTPSSPQVLVSYGSEWIVQIQDVTDFVNAQHEHVKRGDLTELMVPEERVYPVTDQETATQLRVDSVS